jgi:hypothetical protein
MGHRGESFAEAESHKVQRAFRLGWRFAQMFHDPHQAVEEPQKRPEKPPRHLPALSELTTGQRARLLMREIHNDVGCLNDELPDDLKIDAVVATVSALAEEMGRHGTTPERQFQILEAYTRLRVDLGAADPHLGTALDLGRILADTVLLSVSATDFRDEFGRFRLANVYGWLEDLHAYFPPYAADTVKGSLELWQGWMSQHAAETGGEQGAIVRRSLTRQGEKWRRILSGEILAEELLTASDYGDAASFFLRRLRGLVWSFLRRFWPVVLPLAAVVAAIVYVIVKYAPNGPASVAAYIATAAGTLGVSWKTVSSTLGKVAANAEQPLWNAEVLESIVMAATVLPADMNRAKVTALRQQARDAEAHLGQPPAPRPPGPAAPAPNAVPEPSPAPDAPPAAADSPAGQAP